MSKNLLIALLVLGELALIAVVWSERSRTAVLAERVSQLEIVDYRQETANKEFEAQINIARQCINLLLEDPRVRAYMPCNQEAISASVPWGYMPTHGALENGPPPDPPLRVFETRPLEGSAK